MDYEKKPLSKNPDFQIHTMISLSIPKNHETKLYTHKQIGRIGKKENPDTNYTDPQHKMGPIRHI